jgi:hypothetical protein
MLSSTPTYTSPSPFFSVLFPWLQGSSSLDDSDQHHDDGDHQEDMNKPANRVPADESEEPQNQENHEDRPQHVGLLFSPIEGGGYWIRKISNNFG